MRRSAVNLLLLGCAGLVLGAPGCSNRTATIAVGIQPSESETPSSVTEKPKVAEAPFRLPADTNGALLSRVLPPTAHRGALANPTHPTPPAVPTIKLTEQSVELPSLTPEAPRLPGVVKRKSVMPELASEETLEASFSDPRLPSRPELAAPARARLSSVDAAIPPAMPILAQPVQDRASLEDATMEVSSAEVLKGAMPQRNTAAPYQRVKVPEPFENRQPLTLPVPSEETAPAVDPSRPRKP